MVYPIETFGPYGGKGGTQWDDGTYSTVREVIIYASTEIIYSIQVIYDNDGEPVWEGKHGADEGGDPYTVKLDPDEYLDSITGYHEVYTTKPTPLDVVRSLTFTTSNNKTHGPYGKEEGTKFSTPSGIGKIVGFHGRSGDLLDAIGIRVQTSNTTIFAEATIPTGSFGGPSGQKLEPLSSIIIMDALAVLSLKLGESD